MGAVCNPTRDPLQQLEEEVQYLRGAVKFAQGILSRVRSGEKIDTLLVLRQLEWARLRSKFRMIRIKRAIRREERSV